MHDTMFIMAGAVLAALLVGLSHLGSQRRRFGIYGVGLIIAALVYVVLAAVDGGTFMAQEFGGALIFAAMALAGMRSYPWALALGWALHVGWDVGLHGTFSPIAPSWYPLACLGFDLVLAGAILDELLARRSLSTPPLNHHPTGAES